ncbi:MAG TPA: EamA family transporter [Terriglobales bacterium]|nr:EamA family transporter [Terriglobales bacterium]
MRHIYTWVSILAVVTCSTIGDVLISHAMKRVGDVGHVWQEHGFFAVAKRMFTNTPLWLGVFFMALAFFSLMFALSWADVSLVAPASASLTFLTNAIAAKFFLREKVDRRRWIAAILVACGVVLIAG